jgi:hypothetical protein
MDRLGANTTVPVGERTPDAGRSADAPAPYCTDCPPLKRYDNTEVIKTSLMSINHASSTPKMWCRSVPG